MGKRREDTKGSENKVQRPGGCRGLQASTPLGDFRELVREWLLGMLAVWKPLESSSLLQLPRKSALAKLLWGQVGLSLSSHQVPADSAGRQEVGEWAVSTVGGT